MQFISFFELRDKLKISPIEYFRLKSNFENQVLGFRDFDYKSESSVFMVLLSDMNAVSRVDSYITNLKMPWDKSDKDEIFFSVGRLEMYIIKNKDNFKFQLVFGLPYGSQAICCVFSGASDLFGVGCDDGTVFYYKLDRKKKPFYSLLFEQRIHKRRVMGVAIDSTKNLGYSIGEDGCFNVVDLNRKLFTGSILKSSNSKSKQTDQTYL